jgi:hypothetical protein
MKPSIPQKKLLLMYDPLPERREEYFRYVLGEFIPTMEYIGLKLCEAWHTAYGEYPLRLNGFISVDERTVDEILHSSDFIELEERLQDFVINYHKKIVDQTSRFQF